MTKLIIRHGERVTEHSITDQALVVGRDPQCDLFFADKKLSRRHARFEKRGGRVRLVDLGSRNGCWVNEERIDEGVLGPTDSIRLGGLSISLEPEPDREEADADQDSTVVLSKEPPPEDSRTVVLSSASLPDASSADPSLADAAPNDAAPPDDAPSPDDVGTVILTGGAAAVAGEHPDDDPTMRQPGREGSGSEAERTVMLGGDTAPVAADTGTVIFRNKRAEPVDTAMWAPPASAPEDPLSAPISDDTNLESADLVEQRDSSEWETVPELRSDAIGSFRFVALVIAVGGLALAVLALPLLRTLGGALETESALRGRALVELLAITNEAALRDNRPGALSTSRFASEPGVLAAYIVDPTGKVLAPAGTRGEPAGGVWANLGVDAQAQDIRAFRESPGKDGTLVYALPVRAEGRRLGIAVLHFRAGAAVSTWTTLMLLLGSLLLLMGVAAAVVVARRWTLAPVQELRDDVEALRRGIVDNVAEDRPYSDLTTIARSFNELVGRGGDSTILGDASTTYRPQIDPTLVPDDDDQP